MKISDKIKLVKLSDIKPYKNNPKIHNPEQIAQIKFSIEDNKYINPIIVGKNNEIICGHGRYEALKQIMKPAEKIEVIDGSYLTAKQIKKYRILDNKIAEGSEWDMEKLEQEINDIYSNKHFEDSLNEIGFEDKYVDNLFKKENNENIEIEYSQEDKYYLNDNGIIKINDIVFIFNQKEHIKELKNIVNKIKMKNIPQKDINNLGIKIYEQIKKII